MNAQIPIADQQRADSSADPLEAARSHIAARALRDSTRGQVGLELEFHLIDLGHPARRPAWDEIASLITSLPAMPGGSQVSVEPGGQLELSTPPVDGVVSAVRTLRRDQAVLRAALAEHCLAGVTLGADPVRPPKRVNPGPRYVAMQRHFEAVGCGRAGTAMMTATAALQINLDAGPSAGWADRLHVIESLAPC